MSLFTKKNATVVLNVIAALPLLIELGLQGAAAGRALRDALRGSRA